MCREGSKCYHQILKNIILSVLFITAWSLKEFGDGYGYDSGSGDGLFDPPPDPVMDAAKEAMMNFAPSEERQQRVWSYFRGKDNNASGKVVVFEVLRFASFVMTFFTYRLAM